MSVCSCGFLIEHNTVLCFAKRPEEQENEIMKLKGETAAKDAKIIEMEKLDIEKENLLESRINESAV